MLENDVRDNYTVLVKLTAAGITHSGEPLRVSLPPVPRNVAILGRGETPQCRPITVVSHYDGVQIDIQVLTAIDELQRARGSLTCQERTGFTFNNAKRLYLPIGSS